MGVDYYPCKSCADVLCDCGDRIHYCGECGEVICTDCLVKPAEYDDKSGEMLGECCPFCSGAEVHNDDLLRWLLDKCGLTMEVAVEMYKEAKEVDEPE